MILRKKIFLALSALILVAVVYGASSLLYRIFNPNLSVAYWLSVKYPIGFWNPENLDFQDAWITTEDGVKLHGWYIPHKSPRATVLYAHGSGGNITWRTDALKRLSNDLSLSILIFDYRGYGKSEGVPNEQGIYTDVRAAKKWLSEKAMVAAENIVLLGASLGGAVMIDLAASEGARGLILVDTFPSIAKLRKNFDWLPESAWGGEEYSSDKKIEKYNGPLFMKHGDADTVAPYELAKDLFDLANEPKQLLSEPGGKHDGRSDKFYQAVDLFIGNLK